MEITLKETNIDWLIKFSQEYYKRTITKYSPYWERYALTSYDQYLTFNKIYEIINLGKTVGFAIVPSFQEDILSSLYIAPESRCSGLGSQVIELLGIKQLSCISENTNALRVYFKLGFKEVQTNDPFKGSIKMQRI